MPVKFLSVLIKSFQDTSIWISLLPMILHIIEKGLDRFSPFEDEKLREQMKESPQNIVASIGKSKENFAAVNAYFDFEKRCHFIISLMAFNILSLIVFQFECFDDWRHFNTIFLCLILLLFFFVSVFLLRLANGKFHPAQANPRSTRDWEYAAISLFAVVIIFEVFVGHGTTVCKSD